MVYRLIKSSVVLLLLTLPLQAHADIVFQQLDIDRLLQFTSTNDIPPTPNAYLPFTVSSNTSIVGGKAAFYFNAEPCDSNNEARVVIYDNTAAVFIALPGSSFDCVSTTTDPFLRESVFSSYGNGGGGAGVLVAGNDLWFVILGIGTDYTINTYENSAGQMFGVLYSSSTDPSPTPNFGITRIIETYPANNATTSTSSATTFGANGFVHQDDYEDGSYIRIRYAQQSTGQAAVGNPDLLFTELELPISASGFFDVSTTSVVDRAGRYIMNTSIETPSITSDILNFLGFGQFATFGILSATSTVFIVDHLTAFDIFVASTTQSILDVYASSTVSFESCTSWTGFSLLDCLNLLFVPPIGPIQEALSNFKDVFLSYVPWGYLTRFISILATSYATSTMPVFSAQVAMGNPSDVATFEWDIGDMISGGSTLLDSFTDPHHGLTFREVVQPILRVGLAILLIVILIKDLLRGVGAAHTSGADRRKK